MASLLKRSASLLAFVTNPDRRPWCRHRVEAGVEHEVATLITLRRAARVVRVRISQPIMWRERNRSPSSTSAERWASEALFDMVGVDLNEEVEHLSAAHP